MLAAALLLGGCQSPREPLPRLELLLEVPTNYSGGAARAGEPTAEWWRSFGSEALDEGVATALEANRELGAAWARLEQSRALVGIESAAAQPTLDANADLGLNRQEDRAPVGLPAGFDGFSVNEYNYSLGLRLGWTLDLWGKIAARTEAAVRDAQARERDYEETARLLAGSVATRWIERREALARLALIEEQERTGVQLLGLTELRFEQGLGSAVQILQQRGQVAATRSELPRARLAAERAELALATLQGRAASLEAEARLRRKVSETASRRLPPLPPEPALGRPAELVRRRPDVAAAWLRLAAAERRVAVAVLDRLPELTMTGSYSFARTQGERLFNRETGSLTAALLAPLLDGGRREAEILRSRASLREQVEAFAAAWLRAMEEVEAALLEERRGAEVVARIRTQLEFAERTLERAREAYASGAGEYTDVLLAVQSLQSLQRSLLRERAALLSARVRLHLALGSQEPLTLRATVPAETSS